MDTLQRFDSITWNVLALEEELHEGPATGRSTPS